MGNEASLEGEPGQPGAASASAPSLNGQLPEPRGGSSPGPRPGPALNSIQGKPTHTDPSNGPKPGGTVGTAPDRDHVAPRSPHGDAGGAKSPYSLPQIAPMPSRKLCPVCKTADLTGVTDGQPNCNTCTQCRATVCNQCGFNPNPHLTEVQEWLCLNCQMQRALGMDMETPRSKSQQQIHSPSQPPSKPQCQTAPQTPSSVQTKPFPASQNELKPQSQPSTPAKDKVKPQSQPTPSPQTQPKPQSQPSTPSHAQAKPLSTPQPQSKSQSQPPTPSHSQPKTLSFPQTQPKPQSQPPTPSHSQPKPQSQPPTPSHSQPKPLSTPQTQPKSQSQPPTPSHSQPRTPSTPQTQQKSHSQPPTPTKSHPNPPLDQPFGKLFGFGASLLNQASNLISAEQTPHPQPPQTPQKGPTPIPKPAAQPAAHAVPPPQQQKSRPKVCCLLCQTELNVGIPSEAPNYNHCTQCHAQVCNMCGFNPTPHLTEKKEWLCLTCQTQRAMTGKLGDGPPPAPQPTGSPRAPSPVSQQQRGPSQQAPVRHLGPQQHKTQGAQVSGPLPPAKQGVPQSKGPIQPSPAKTTPTQPASKSKAEIRKQEQGVSKKQGKTEKEGEVKAQSKKATPDVKDQKRSSDLQKSKHHDESNKSSTQSLSDTGYSSDGISSSQGEITGLIQEEGIKLNEGGLPNQRGPPSPSEITKLESSMRPLLQSQTVSDTDKQRPQSLSITEDQFDSDGEVSDDLSCKLRHDYVEDSSESGLSPLPNRQKLQKDLTDEEFMRKQIMEMSADEEEMVVTEGHVRIKKSSKQGGDLGKEKRRLTQQSNSFEEDSKTSDEAYKSSEGDDMVSQGGLRRFKTIELNNTNSYNRDLELTTEHDLREPELEMESLTGSPEERSKGEYSSTLPATTPSYTSGTSPTSVSSLEEDSDSSPSRRQRLEEVKQQRKARHRSHGPLLPTIEDSSEEDELREEEELLREQEKMRDLEQQRIRSTARKTKRDKEELRAQRRRERSKTPPSNLSPIEDASPTEELRQAAEMEELHRSSCSEYSPSMDSEAEGFEVSSKLYKSGSEYNLPTFMSLYSPTEKNAPTSPSTAQKSLKSAEEVYEEMMKKAEMMQKQQAQQGRLAHLAHNQHLITGSSSLSPGTSPTQIVAPVSFLESGTSGRGTAKIQETQHFAQQNQARVTGQAKVSHQSQVQQSSLGQPQARRSHMEAGPTQSSSHGQGPGHTTAGLAAQSSHIPQRIGTPRLTRQQSSQDAPVMVITLGSGTTSQPAKPVTVNSSTSPLSSPTSSQQKPVYRAQSAKTSCSTSPQKSQLSSQRAQTAEMVTIGVTTATQIHRSPSSENISFCKISNVPGTSRVVEQGTVTQSSTVVDLRAMKPAPIIMTDHGMDLTSLASDTRRYSIDIDQPSSRHTAVQPLIMNLNAQEQPHVTTSTPTTVSVTVAASMFISQHKQPMVYGDPLHNRVDFGQGVGSAICLTQTRPSITDPSIPKIDACLEDLGIQQQQLQKQQQKLQHQQQLLEQQLQHHQQNAASFARYNLANQVQPILLKKDLVVNQSSGGNTQTVISAITKVSPLPPQPLTSSVSSTPTIGHDIYGGIALELKNKPTVVNLATGQPHEVMVQLDESSSQGATVSQIVKKEEPPRAQEVLDLTGQVKPENQVACCDVVYKLPFPGSCSGSFGQSGKSTISEPNPAGPTKAPHQQIQSENIQGILEEHKPFTIPPPGQIPPSMSDTNLSESGLQYYQRADPGDLAVDLSSMKQAYEAGYLGVGAQYGSYTDLRHQGDFSGSPLPLRRYGSMSNISGDFGYPRDIAGIPESNLAQYSATTAREISRMCAALNSMEQLGSRYSNSSDLFQYGAGRGGPTGRLTLQQGLASIRANLLYGPDGRPTGHGQAITNLINARQASLRALYPPAMRTADGMIYSTINTPIASTLPITTQPTPVINSMLRGVYRPYPPCSVTAVPLASITRLPQVTPRMPLSSQGPYRYPIPNNFPSSTPDSIAGSIPPTSTSQETPVYLGKSTVAGTTTTTVPPGQASTALHGAPRAMPTQPILTQQISPSHVPVDGILSQTQISPALQQQTKPQTQSQLLNKGQDLALTQSLSLSQTSQPRAAGKVLPEMTGTVMDITSTDKEKDQEEDCLRQQQEQLLQMERERIELEKLRQMRLHEELERDRLELQRHREKEQLLVQREIQELQNIKQQVLHQQQAERENQLVLQREQLAQQRMQLDQIQALQQQLQQQLEEQKRQKTAAVEAAAAAETAAETTQSSINGLVTGAAPQTISIICDQSGRVIPQGGQSLQFLPCVDGQVVQALVSTRPMPSSASEMSLKNNDDQSSHAIKKQNSMPRLRNGAEEEPIKRIADSSVQTDDEDAEDRFMSRRRRTRRIADCSVQTDEEDQGEWDSQPVRRRRSRYTKHSESTSETKNDASRVTSSIAIQTTSDSSCQTEQDQLGRVSPAIHITMAETSKVELLHYISAPERTQKGESLACQTDPEAQSHGVVAPQLGVSTTVSPYSTSLQIVGATSTKFERRKPDPLEIGLQAQKNDTRPPKSPQVLYSPVSPLSPHRMLETTFASSEKLNKAHVTPQQKAYTTESPKRHQTVPRPIKNVQRSMSDPKPLSPTSEDPSKTKFSLYPNQISPASQHHQNSMMRKVKRTLPSPPPEETPLPIVSPAMTHMYSSPQMPQRVLPRTGHGITKAGLLSELKAVEQESTKLRKQQAELEEEEKEIDAKLRFLELGITQRKETMVKERERRELAYLRGMGDARDYMSDSELNNLGLTGVATGTYERNGLLSRPGTAPLSQYTSDPNVTQYPPTSSYVPYPYSQSQPAPAQPPTAAYQPIGFQTTQYATPSQPQPGTFQPHPPQPSSYQTQGAFQSHGYAQSYQPDLGLQQPSHQSFQPPAAHLPGHALPYPGQSLSYQPQADILSAHQLPRHTSLADLEQKLPTNYEVITNPAVSIATSAQETGFSGAYSSPLTNAYGPYHVPDQTMMDRIPSPTSGFAPESPYTTNLEQNIPRNYVMIDDISELTKENLGPSDASRTGYVNDSGPRGMRYGDGTEDSYGRADSSTSYHQQGAIDSHSRPSTTVSGGSSYYYDDYKHSSRGSSGMGSQKHSSKNLAPAAVSSKRSKHRKQGMEHKVSKFSPIEEARDVESDLASYTMTPSTDGSCTVVSRSGVKKNVYDQQKYYGSREGLDEDDRLYNSGRSRSTGYGMDKISSRDSAGYRSKSYERDAMERSQRGTHGRSGRSTMRTQNSEEESPLSPVGKPVGIGRVSDPHDVRNQYGSSHSLPDVQDHHMRDIPKSHAYKPDDPYLVDDMHCAVSDSEAYHLGQEETDWFEKPREAADRSRHHGSGGHSSSGKRSHVKHTYHDYDEPPEEDLWIQDEYGHQRQSSSSREHRHHGSNSGRHSSSRHMPEDPRTPRSSRSHPKDTSARSEGRNTMSSTHKRSAEPRSSQSGYRDSGEYSRDPVSGHHHSSGGPRGQRQSGTSKRQESPGSRQQQQLQQQHQQQGSGVQHPPPQQVQQRSTGQPTASKQPGSQHHETGQQGQQTSQQPRTQHQQPSQHLETTTAGGAQSSPAPTGIGAGAAQQQAKPGQPPTSGQQQAAGATTAQPAAPGGGQAKLDSAPAAPTPAVAIGSKAAPQPAKVPTIPATGIGSKAVPRPGGIGSAAQPTQQPAESENVFSKILPGGAAEQAGKLGDAVSAIGKKFTSFW